MLKLRSGRSGRSEKVSPASSCGDDVCGVSGHSRSSGGGMTSSMQGSKVSKVSSKVFKVSVCGVAGNS